MTYAVALYVDDRFEGRVGYALRNKTEAREAADRWRMTHAYKHDYRAIELDADGRLLWVDAKVVGS